MYLYSNLRVFSSKGSLNNVHIRELPFLDGGSSVCDGRPSIFVGPHLGTPKILAYPLSCLWVLKPFISLHPLRKFSYKKCSLKFRLLKNAISGLGVWEPQKYIQIKSVQCLSNIGPQLFFERHKVLEN